jgi:putative copper resistance protein D
VPPIVDALVLWVHLFSAVLFVGGSFFMWIVVVPASHMLTEDESERTRIVGKIAKQFAKVVNPSLLVLVVTGVYNVTWYLPSAGALLGSYSGRLLAIKVSAVAALLVLLYISNVYFGRRITRLAREGRLEELKALRRTSRLVSFANLGLMAFVLLLVALMQAEA